MSQKCSQKWSGLPRLVVQMIDHSGSMAGVIHSVRMECAAIGEALRAQGVPVHYIVFDDQSCEGPALEELRSQGNGTLIAQAFELLLRLLAERGTPNQLDVVFVSDGESSRMPLCISAIDAMQTPECLCRLLSVGVGCCFPTTLVTDHLYPKFGRDSDIATPPVIPMEERGDATGVFAYLLSLLATAQQSPPPRLEDLTADTPPVALLEGAHRAYNACMHACFFMRGHCPIDARAQQEALSACFKILSMSEGLYALHQHRVPCRQEGKRRNALPSQLLALNEPSAAEAVQTIQALRRQVRECMHKAERDVLLSTLDNDTKRNIAGFAGRCARVHAQSCATPPAPAAPTPRAQPRAPRASPAARARR